VAILMLTMYDDEGTVTTAMRAGAMGYILKGADPDDVVAAIHAVARGGAVLGPGVAARALERIAQGTVAPPFPTLTAREREVLDLIARGMANASIAARLSLSPHTVGNHVTSIFANLGVATRSEAIVRAREAGLGG
jgi:DNA-binding NarL/FixJ family response regulator